MDMPDPQDAHTVNVRVIARQFNWTFWYAGKDGRFGTADDFDDAVLKVPVSDPGPDGRWNTDDDIQSKVLLEMRSRDVIHSFFLPHMRLKQDVLPGMKTRAWFAATRTGTFEIACAELCGAQHYSMSASLEVVEHRDFLDYLERRAGKMTVKGPNEHGEDELLAAWWQRVFPE
jgi:cytochrome c oxidase subunit 2